MNFVDSLKKTLYASGAALALACGGEPTRPEVLPDTTLPDTTCDAACLEYRLAADTSIAIPYDSLIPILTRTYDGSNEAVHPDIVYIPGGWNGWRFWRAYTPYPQSTGEFDENPSVDASNNGRYFAVPGMITNPLARSPPGSTFSDPDVVFSGGRLIIYYREINYSTNRDNIYRIELSGKEKMAGPELSVSDSAFKIISPSIITSDTSWLMTAIDASPSGCVNATTAVTERTSLDRGRTWSPPMPTGLAQPERVIWHIDRIRIASRREDIAIYPAFVLGGRCGSTDVFIARKPDGGEWQTFSRPLLARGESPEFPSVVYRSTIYYDERNDDVIIQFSGANYAALPFWHMAARRFRYRDLFSYLQAPPFTSPVIAQERSSAFRILPSGMP